MTRAAPASISIVVCVEAAERSKYCRSRPMPPTNAAAPRTSSEVPRIEPSSDALTTSCSPAPSANRAMMSSGALPNVTLSSPPMPGPERVHYDGTVQGLSAAVAGVLIASYVAGLWFSLKTHRDLFNPPTGLAEEVDEGAAE